MKSCLTHSCTHNATYPDSNRAVVQWVAGLGDAVRDVLDGVQLHALLHEGVRAGEVALLAEAADLTLEAAPPPVLPP